MYRIHLCYDGTAYAGYQRQKNANTVGEEVLRAASAVFGKVEKFTGCSRTDSGVHANDYVISFVAEKTLACSAVVRALNARLPHDIAVFSCETVADDFHARYSVLSKEYVYLIYNASIRSPFYEKYALFYPRKLDEKLMNDVIQEFLGSHDFHAFMASGSKIKDTVRTVKSARVVRDGELVKVYIEADGFLYNMVRIIVGTLLEVCEGKIASDGIYKIIEEKNRDAAGRTAPAHGLYLNRVYYG